MVTQCLAFRGTLTCLHSLNIVFHKEKGFNLDEVQFINLFLFGIISKSSLPNMGHKDFLSKSFVVLRFTFRSLLSFELI